MEKQNTKILYLFRDENNMKTQNEEVVKGEMGEEQIKQIIDSLLDRKYFVPERVGLSERRFGQYSAGDLLFELDEIVITQEEPTTDLTADELIQNFIFNRGKWEDCCTSQSLRVRVAGGWLIASVSTDPQYPGIDVELVPDEPDDEMLSNPRVLLEQPEGEKLRAYVWGCPTQEEYTHRVDFGR